MSTATLEAIRFGTGPVGETGCEFLASEETAGEFWTDAELAGPREFLPGIAGDLDGDGDVDSGDAASLIGEWTAGESGSTRVGDLNGDGEVGPSDLSLLLALIGYPPDPETVPEEHRPGGRGPDLKNFGCCGGGLITTGPQCTWIYGCGPGEAGGDMGTTPGDEGGGGDCPGCPGTDPPTGCQGPCCDNPCGAGCGGDPCSAPCGSPCGPGCLNRSGCEGDEDNDDDGILDNTDGDDDNDGIPDNEEFDPEDDGCQMIIELPWTGGLLRPPADLIAIPFGQTVELSMGAEFRGATNASSYAWSVAGPAELVYPDSPRAGIIRVLQPGRITMTLTLDDQTVPCTLSESYSFTAITPRLKAVSYGGSGFHAVTRDGDTTVTPHTPQTVYESPQWRDVNLDGDADDDDPTNPDDDRGYPLCYVRGSRLTAQIIVIDIDSGNAPVPPMTIWGTSLASDLTFAGHLNIGGGVGTAGPLPSLNMTGNGVAFLDDTLGREQRAISWRIRWDRDGLETFQYVGTSRNKIYRTAGPPATSPLYETLLNLPCNTAAGWPRLSREPGQPDQTEEELVDLIWRNFDDQTVRRVDGETLGYYRGGSCDLGNSVYHARELLKQLNGQCASWADLFARTLMAQGVGRGGQNGVLLVQVEPIRTGAGAVPDCVPGFDDQMGFLVNQYCFIGAGGSGCVNYPYRINAPCSSAEWTWPTPDVTDLNGVPGQDSADPASFFARHFIVKYGNKYFDPSYGTGPFIGATEDVAAMLWENASIAGYYGLGVGTYQGQSVVRYVARQGTAAREIVFTLFDPVIP